MSADLMPQQSVLVVISLAARADVAHERLIERVTRPIHLQGGGAVTGERRRVVNRDAHLQNKGALLALQRRSSTRQRSATDSVTKSYSIRERNNKIRLCPFCNSTNLYKRIMDQHGVRTRTP